MAKSSATPTAAAVTSNDAVSYTTQHQPPINDNDKTTKTTTADNDDDDEHLRIWLRPDCYTLYQTHIIPQSTAVKKRAGMIRFSMNVAYSVKKRYPKAQFLEFGVAQGKDMVRMVGFLSQKEQHLAACDKTTIHGFDSFHGLPEAWDNGQVHHETGEGLFRLGHFDAGGNAPLLDALQQKMRVCHHGNSKDGSNQCPVEFHAGWFQDTVPAFFVAQQQKQQQEAIAPIAFVHADADLYSSTITFLNEICQQRLLVVGSVITFDEYANYENWQDGEYRAWMEICARYNISFDYLCHHAPNNTKAGAKFTLSKYGYQSVSVIITNVGDGGE